MTTSSFLPGMGQSWPLGASPRSPAFERVPSSQSFVATPACVLSTKAKCYRIANKWLSARLRRGRLACNRLLGLLRDFYKRKRALGKESKIALMVNHHAEVKLSLLTCLS
jgi:hypothetical protein